MWRRRKRGAERVLAGWTGLRFLIQEGPQSGITAAADRKLLSAAQDDDIVVLAIGLDFRDSLQVDDIGAVNAKETLRVEGSFQAGDGLLFQMLLSFGAERDVVILRFGEVELRHRNHI